MTKKEQKIIDRYATAYANNMNDTLRKEIALNLIREGIRIDTVVLVTGLPVDEILRMDVERKIV